MLTACAMRASKSISSAPQVVMPRHPLRLQFQVLVSRGVDTSCRMNLGVNERVIPLSRRAPPKNERCRAMYLEGQPHAGVGVGTQHPHSYEDFGAIWDRGSNA